MMDGWTFEDGIRVNKDAWPVDVTTHLTNGMNLFEEELGFRPNGMWPSEQPFHHLWFNQSLMLEFSGWLQMRRF